jgi:hypothetical protein
MVYYGYIYKVTDLLNKHNLPSPFYYGNGPNPEIDFPLSHMLRKYSIEELKVIKNGS